MRSRKINKMGTNIPVISHTDDPQNDPNWTSFYGNILHPDFSNPVFFRHNGVNMNFFNWYNGDTVYLIARGPSIAKHLENKEVRKLLLHPSIVKYGMNTSPEIIDNHVNLWSGVDKMRKFSSSILKNPNIMKFIPMNRYQVISDGTKDGMDSEKGIAYKDDKHRYTCHCPNTVGVQTFLLEEHPKSQMSFGNSYLGSTAVLYGYYKGMKSVFLFTLKVCILLGFKRIIMLGVDFKMSNDTPYYKNTAADYPKFHIDHNNKLYNTLGPQMKDINRLLKTGESGYRTKILTATPIESMPFIESINLKEELEREIETKS